MSLARAEYVQRRDLSKEELALGIAVRDARIESLEWDMRDLAAERDAARARAAEIAASVHAFAEGLVETTAAGSRAAQELDAYLAAAAVPA